MDILFILKFTFLLISYLSEAKLLHCNFVNCNENAPILSVLTEILNTILKDFTPVIVFDASIFLFIGENNFFELLKASPIAFYCVNNLPKNSTNSLLNSQIQKSDSVAVLLTGQALPWLNDHSLLWKFNTVVIINVNMSLNSQLLLNSALIQRSLNVVLFEPFQSGSRKNNIGVFASFPFNVNKNFKARKMYLGQWDSSKFGTFEALFPPRFPTFNGAVLHVSTDHDDHPLVILNNGLPDGISIRTLKVISQKFNFTFTTTESSPDLYWGEKVDGVWKGHLGAVYRGDKNLTVNYFTITGERHQEFDHSVPYFYEGFGFALLQPSPFPPWISLIHPFHYLTWIILIAITCSIGVVFYYITKGPSSGSYALSLQVCYLETFKGLARQSLSKLPKNHSTRLSLMTWWLSCLVITVSYTGNLIAVLTIPAYPPKITTVEGLSKSDLKLAMVDYGEFVPEALANSKDAILHALGQKMVLSPMCEVDPWTASWTYLVEEMMLRRKYALIETYSYLVKTVKGHPVGKPLSYFLKEQIYMGPLAFFYKQSTPWQYQFNDVINSLVESGIINKWYIDIMEASNFGSVDGPPPPANTAKPLSITHLQGAFLLLLFGLILSLIVFLAELIITFTVKT